MPNSSSAKKSLRQNRKRRLENRTKRTGLRSVLKKFATVAAGDDAEAKELAFRTAAKRLDQAAAKGLIHKNKASRTKSRLAHHLNAASASATPADSSSSETAE